MKLKKFTYFYPEKPVLILKESDAFNQMSNDPNYVAEPKYNEQRCELHLIDGVGHFWDRHGKALSYDSNFGSIEGKNKIVDIFVDKVGDKGYFLFDCGLRHNKVEGIKNKLVIYDIHVYKNELLNKMIFKDRRKLLESLNFSIFNGDTVHLIYQYKDIFKRHFDSFIAGYIGDPDEFEGLVIKNLNGKLKLGRSSGSDSLWMFKVRKQTGRHRY